MNAKLGDKARNPINGFAGTVTAIAHYLYGNTLVQVTAPILSKEGTTIQEWFPEDMLVDNSDDLPF